MKVAFSSSLRTLPKKYFRKREASPEWKWRRRSMDKSPKNMGRRKIRIVSLEVKAYPMGIIRVARWTIFRLISTPVIISKTFSF